MKTTVVIFATIFSSIAPAPAGETAVEPAAKGPATPATDLTPCDIRNWEGVWETNWGPMTLTFDDGVFSGTYGSAVHGVEGRFDPQHPDMLSGRWTHRGGVSTGRFQFRMTESEKFDGAWTWGREDPAVDGGAWTGIRRVEGSGMRAILVGDLRIVERGQVKDGPPKRWREQWVPITNGSGLDFFLHGSSPGSPHIQTESLDPGTGRWVNHGPYYCSNGAGWHRFPQGASFTVKVSLPEAVAHREFTITLSQSVVEDPEAGIRVRTERLRMAAPEPESPMLAAPATRTFPELAEPEKDVLRSPGFGREYGAEPTLARPE